MRVLDVLVALFCQKYGCEAEDVIMAASLDDLNIAPYEREDMALLLEELYGVAIEPEELYGFQTVEDIVGYVEDTLAQGKE